MYLKSGVWVPDLNLLVFFPPNLLSHLGESKLHTRDLKKVLSFCLDRTKLFRISLCFLYLSTFILESFIFTQHLWVCLLFRLEGLNFSSKRHTCGSSDRACVLKLECSWVLQAAGGAKYLSSEGRHILNRLDCVLRFVICYLGWQYLKFLVLRQQQLQPWNISILKICRTASWLFI